jgi:hypothetical protein
VGSSRRVPPALLLAIVAVGAAGCGTIDDRDQARATTQRFFAALQRGDGAGACGQLGEASIKQLIQEEHAPCAEAVRRLNLTAAPITSVRVFVTNAKVDLSNSASAFLDRSPNGWKLSAVGCRSEGKPADRPYACELED